MSKKSRNEFDKYFSNKIAWLTSPDKISKHIIFHDYSHQEPCLQVADYLAGSLYQLFENNDSRYYDMIKHKVTYIHQWGE